MSATVAKDATPNAAIDPTVDASSPLEDRAAQAIAHIQKAMDLLAIPEATSKLTAKQRQRGLKFRKGAEKPMRSIAALATRHGIQVPAHPPEKMLATLERARVLQTVQLHFVAALATLSSAIFHDRASSYASALTLYGILKRVGHQDGDLQHSLAPVEAFFSYRSRTPPKPAAQTPAAPEASTKTAPARAPAHARKTEE